MELWIRSQNKSNLCKTNHVYVANDNVYCDKDFLGEYKTKERALEVLDEIQTEISNYVGTMAQIVYEMPEE